MVGAPKAYIVNGRVIPINRSWPDTAKNKDDIYVNLPTYGTGPICSFKSAFCGFGYACFLDAWHGQQAGDALVQLEEEGDAFGVGCVGLFAAAGLVGGVYGGVEFLVGLEQGRGHGQWVVEVGQ